MKFTIFRVLVPFFIAAFPVLASAQFIYEFKGSPDSSEVYLNGVLQGKAPLKVKFVWENIPDSGLVFKVQHDNYTPETFAVKEKPRVIKTSKTFELKKIIPHFALDSASSLVEFDKLLAEFPSGKVIGQAKAMMGSASDLTWDGFSRLGSDPISVKAYDVLGTVGFNTPLKEEHQLFSTEKRVRKTPRFLLGAKVTELWVDLVQISASAYTGSIYKSTVKMTIEWQVFDRSMNQVVAKEKSYGEYSDRHSGDPDQSVLVDAFGNALYAFLGKGKLYELVKAAGTAPTVEAPKEESKSESLTIPKTASQKFESIPEMIQYATQASVTVTTDAGHGSGVLITDDGYIMTAAHVVDGVNRLNIVFSNGVELEAKVITMDVPYDIALLKVPGSRYKTLPFGPGLTAGLGEEVVTIGTPGDLELGQSVSKGILSGKRKQDDIVYLQTDVSVSPGNSGGPLINGKGQIIGIIQRKLIGTGIEGVGFALPIETALKRLNLTVGE